MTAARRGVERVSGAPEGGSAPGGGGLTVVAGHVNPDFDAYGAMVAGTKLFPGSRAVFGGTQNLNVREFHALHGEFLAFADLKGLDLAGVSRLVMVDTREAGRLGELAPLAEDANVDLVVYDHHPASSCDVTRGEDRSFPVGAVTSILVHELREREVALSPLEASAMLLGIHEDTGSLTFPGSTAYDADAVAYLMAQGADLEVLGRFLRHPLGPDQRILLDGLVESLVTWDVHGREIAIATAAAPEFVDSAGLVSHYLVEDLSHHVVFAVVEMPERIQVVGRSRVPDVDVSAVLAHLGGGGHRQAAAAAVRDSTMPEVLDRLRAALEAEVRPALTAGAIASAPVRTAAPTDTMDEVALVLLRWGHGVLPVAAGGKVIGLVTRRDVDKAVRHGLGHAPVTGFMRTTVAKVSPETDLDELERLMSTDSVDAVLVVRAGALAGIVTHADLLRSEHGHDYLTAGSYTSRQRASETFRESFGTLLPADVRDAVLRIGTLAQEAGVRAFVVGGFVRDMLLRRRNLDVDVVVEGDGIAFAERVAERLGGRVRAHVRFGTAVVVLERGLHIDVTSARTEYYTRPGALPTVERSSLRQDLLRRDFSINAMAATIDPAEFGALTDPFDGLSDLRDGVVRVLHPLSFVEDPTRVLRAARFERRFGFAMDDASEELARQAVALGMLHEISGARVREELLAILEEEDPVAPLERLHDLGALAVLLPAGIAAESSLRDLAAVLPSFTEMPRPSGRAPRRIPAALVGLAGRAAPAAVEHWVERLRVGHEAGSATAQASRRATALLRTLGSPARIRDSRLSAMLEPLLPEALLYVRALGSPLVRQRVDRFAGTLSHVRLEVTGDDLVALGAAPSPAFSDILARVRARRLDAALTGRDAQLTELKRLAVRAGLIQRG